MPKKTFFPETRVKKPEPKLEETPDDWVIWAAWADRITFEEIFERTGLKEAEVIAKMRSTLKSSSFRLWRKRVHQKVSIKHRKRFVLSRQEEREFGTQHLHYRSLDELQAEQQALIEAEQNRRGKDDS